MKQAVLYYSWSGKTEKRAEALARETGAELFRVTDQKRPGPLKAFTLGAFAALRMKGTPTLPLAAPLEAFDQITVMAPVWAGHPAPAIHAAFAALPPGKSVRVILVSGGGASSCREKVADLVRARGCTLASFEDLRG